MTNKKPTVSATAKRGRGRPSAAELAARAREQEQAKGHAPLSVQNRYDAAGQGRRMASWNPPSSGPNKAVAGLQTIRNRTRDAERNDWAGASSSQKWSTTLIGIGIVPRFKRIKSKERKQFITDLFNDFVANSDADCVSNLYAQQTLSVKTWMGGGEAFARRRDRRIEDGLPVPMQVQLIEPEFCPLFDADNWNGMPVGNRIRQGIELDRRGRRVAYWFYREHPGDNTGNSLVSMDKLVRVLADQVRHIYEPNRPGALRGVSPLAPVLAHLRNVADFDGTVLERQKLANLFMAFIKYTLPSMNDANTDPLTGLPISGSAASPLTGLAPGIIQELDPGQEMQFANPPEAGTMYGEYMRQQNMSTAAGQSLPYELFSGDIKEISDRTLRVIINEFRRFAEQRQWQIIIPKFCQPVVEWFADAALLAGLITLEEADLIKRCEHAPHGWAYIHPVQDPQGKQMEVDSGFRSRSSVIAERGDDPDQVDDERAADKEREEELGLGMIVDPQAPVAGNGANDKQGDNDGIDDEEYSAPPNASIKALIERARAETRLLDARAEKLSKAEPPREPSELERAHLALTERVVNLLEEGDGE